MTLGNVTWSTIRKDCTAALGQACAVSRLKTYSRNEQAGAYNATPPGTHGAAYRQNVS